MGRAGGRVEVGVERLERRQAESEIRPATAVTAMAGTLLEVRDLL
jgi:hypothetical protein